MADDQKVPDAMEYKNENGEGPVEAAGLDLQEHYEKAEAAAGGQVFANADAKFKPDDLGFGKCVEPFRTVYLTLRFRPNGDRSNCSL